MTLLPGGRVTSMTPEEYTEALIQLISEAAPLAWVANQDMDGAAAWEARALQLIQGARQTVRSDEGA